MSKKTQPNRKTKVVLPLETLVEAWAMAQVVGVAAAAAHYQVHPATITRAGAKVAADNALRAIAEVKRQEFAEDWRPQAMRTLRVGMTALERLFGEAKPDQLRDVAGAVHLVAEKIIALDAIGPNVRRNLPTPRQGQKVQGAGSAGGSGSLGSQPAGSAATPAGTGSEPVRH